MKKITLDFGIFSCSGELYDTPAAHTLYESLPRIIPLEQWGNELYGPIGVELNRKGDPHPDLVSEIAPGGIAYSRKGNYLCIFFGQKPAWAVEEIGRIGGTEWEQLLPEKAISEVIIKPLE